MPVIIDEVQVDAVEAQAQPHDASAQAPRSGKPKLDPIELVVALRRLDQRLARLWAD